MYNSVGNGLDRSAELQRSFENIGTVKTVPYIIDMTLNITGSVVYG